MSAVSACHKLKLHKGKETGLCCSVIAKKITFYGKPINMSHFKLISSTKASDVIPVNKYVSDKTGLTVIIANVEGPLVNGFFCLGR